MVRRQADITSEPDFAPRFEHTAEERKKKPPQ